MMKIARFEPWSYVDLLHRDLNRPVADDTGEQWVPAVDIIEDGGRFILRADVPGVHADDIDVSMDNGVLTIAGARRTEGHDEGASIQRRERATGRFSRHFTLPETTDADAIAAKCTNGILEVSIPKQPEVQPRRITVSAA